MADTLRELQAMVTVYYGVPGAEIDPDCPLQDLGIDVVGLEELIVVVEDKYKIVMSMTLGEHDDITTFKRNVKDQTLREFAGWVNQLLCGRSGMRDR
jgi:acyl carrier protein